jgi:hypothetical protein
MFGVAEIAKRKTIQKAKASDPIKTSGRLWDADCAHVMVETELGELDAQEVDGKGAGIRPAQRNRRTGNTTARDTVLFVQD